MPFVFFLPISAYCHRYGSNNLKLVVKQQQDQVKVQCDCRYLSTVKLWEL